MADAGGFGLGVDASAGGGIGGRVAVGCQVGGGGGVSGRAAVRTGKGIAAGGEVSAGGGVGIGERRLAVVDTLIAGGAAKVGHGH